MNRIQEHHRIAILADIHGNSIALDAVLGDIEAKGGVNEYWFLGDYVAIGFDPLGVLEKITSIENASLIRGNTDKYILDNSLPWPNLSDVEKDPSLFELHKDIVRSFSWTAGAVSASGWLEWISNLPISITAVLPDRTKVIAFHASPGNDDGTGINPKTTDEELDNLLVGHEFDLLFVGHTHVPFDRSYLGKRIINPGSISNQFPPDLRAGYAIMEVGAKGYDVVINRVEYDHDAVIKFTEKANHPASAYITKFMNGENLPGWEKEGDG